MATRCPICLGVIQSVETKLKILRCVSRNTLLTNSLEVAKNTNSFLIVVFEKSLKKKERKISRTLVAFKRNGTNLNKNPLSKSNPHPVILTKVIIISNNNAIYKTDEYIAHRELRPQKICLDLHPVTPCIKKANESPVVNIRNINYNKLELLLLFGICNFLEILAISLSRKVRSCLD
jgi:hypothetical protein